MAFSISTNWEVRTTGNDNNGGGFNIASTGTDYSQQDNPQVVYTDLVIGATNTQLTSAANPFTSAHVGNIINITGGTGFTVQRVQINSVTSGVATCDKACGTAASTGGTGNLGGGLATPGKALTAGVVSGNPVWIQTGTYNVATSIIPNAGVAVIAYATTHGDTGRATINWSGGTGGTIFQGASSGSFTYRNLDFTTSSTGTTGIGSPSQSSARLAILNCTFTTVGINTVNFTNFFMQGCSLSTTTSYILTLASVVSCSLLDCYFSGGTTSCIQFQTSSLVVIRNCVFANATSAVTIGGSTVTMYIEGNSFYGFTSYAIQINTWQPSTGGQTNFVFIRNNIFYNCHTGVTAVNSQPQQLFMSNNAVGGNTTNYVNVTSTNDAALTANPFTNTSTPDFSLNSTAGGGAACKGAGWPAATGFVAGPSYPDIGALQSVGGGPSTPSNYGFGG